MSSPSGTASGDATSPTPATSARAPNNLVLQNVAKFQRLLGPSLRADTPGIRQRLLRLIQRLAALYGPGRPPKEFQDATFWDNFQVKCVHAAMFVKTPLSRFGGRVGFLMIKYAVTHLCFLSALGGRERFARCCRYARPPMVPKGYAKASHRIRNGGNSLLLAY